MHRYPLVQRPQLELILVVLRARHAGHTAGHAAPHGAGPLAALSLAALGVVYGDIGTSPIYAMRESLHSAHGVPPTPANVVGVPLVTRLGQAAGWRVAYLVIALVFGATLVAVLMIVPAVAAVADGSPRAELRLLQGGCREEGREQARKA